MSLPLHGFPDWQDPLHTGDLQTDVQFQPLAIFQSFDTPVYDMRAYQSMSLMASLVANPGPKTNFGDFEFQMNWFANAAGTQIIYQDRYAWLPQGAGAGVATSTGRTMYRGPVMGPYLKMTAFSNNNYTCDFSWRLLGNTKPTTQREIINTDVNGQAANDQDIGCLGRFNNNLAAAGNTAVPYPLAPGPAIVSLIAGAAPLKFEFNSANNNTFQTYDLPANTEQHPLVILPKTAFVVVITNTGGVLGSYLIEVTSARLGM